MKKYISNDIRQIVIKQHTYYEKGYISFMSDCIGHIVAMSTQNFHILMMGNLKKACHDDKQLKDLVVSNINRAVKSILIAPIDFQLRQL